MSIKKAGQNIPSPLQTNTPSLVSEVKSQAIAPETPTEVTQNAFETFATQATDSLGATQASGALVGQGQVTSVLQQAISELSGVGAINAVEAVGEMTPAEIQVLDSQTDNVVDRIQDLALDRPEAFAESLQQIYGSQANPETLAALINQAKDGDFPLPAEIRFVDPEMLRGADAAYSPQDGGLVLISRALKDRPARLQVALTEEIGHHLDQVLNVGDSIGDEGELFQRAVAKGGPLSGQELRGGKLDSDMGRITLKTGQTLDVEFRSDKSARYYETQGSFNQVDLRAAGSVSHLEDIYAGLFAKHSTPEKPISTVKELRSHLRSNDISIVTARIEMENELYRTRTGTSHSQEAIEANLVKKFRRRSVNGQPVKTVDDVKAYCEANGRSFDREFAYAERKLWGKERQSTLESKGQEVAHKALAATLIAKLKIGKVLGETDNLQTKLPTEAMARVKADPFLSQQEPPVTTYGDLFMALTTDVDNDGKSDFDSLQLGRFLPHTSQQEILKSLDHPIPNADLKDKLRGAGFEHRLIDRLSARGTLELNPPAAFGMEGKTDVDRFQQQLLLRTGQVFIDSNNDGKVDDNDSIQYIDSLGAVRETTYGELDTNLKKLVKYNMATAKACEDYAGLPSWNRMKFPTYSRTTGESQPERVNEEFWEVSKAEANRGQISWELKEDSNPSEALNDIFNGNGGKYTTECAQGRTLLRLKGLNNYYKSEFGEGQGTFKFNALFAKGQEDKTKAANFLQQFDEAKQANPDLTWDSFVTDNPVPEMKYALEVSRHVVMGDNETYLEPWKRVQSESAAGDTGYFHNYSVSVEGVKIGYVGENVIDLGFKDGKRLYWGHPGGIQTEEKWSEELGNKKIAVSSMSDYSQYFSTIDITRGSARVTKERVADLEESNTELKEKKPAGWEDQVKQNESTIGWWKALDVARQTVATTIDPEKAEAAEDFFKTAAYTNKPESFDPLLETMTSEGIERLAEGFVHFDEGTVDSVLEYFNKGEVGELTNEEKARSTLLLTFAQSGQIHPVLKDEAAGAVKNIHFESLKPMLESGGNLSSKDAFQAWIGGGDFQTWYQEQTGSEYTGEVDLSKMTVAEVQGIVELAFPMVKGMRTIYSEVNSGQFELSEQMATMLKEGKLPEAKYALDSNPVAPLE